MGRDLACTGPDGAPGAGSLADPVLDRGTAHTDAERDRLGIEGLLPPRVETLAEQAARVIANVRLEANPLEQYVCLSAIQAALAARVAAEDLACGRVFPQTRRLREIAIAVAAAVADVAHDEGLATRAWPADARAEAARIMYRPGCA